MGLLWIVWLVRRLLRRWHLNWGSELRDHQQREQQVQRWTSTECLRDGIPPRGARKWKWNQRSHDVWPPMLWQGIKIYSSIRKATGGFWAEEWHGLIVFKAHSDVTYVENWLHLDLDWSDSRALNPYTKECNWGMITAIREGSTGGEITSVWALQGNPSETWLWTVPVT